jgi:hypothetical protein
MGIKSHHRCASFFTTVVVECARELFFQPTKSDSLETAESSISEARFYVVLRFMSCWPTRFWVRKR